MKLDRWDLLRDVGSSSYREAVEFYDQTAVVLSDYWLELELEGSETPKDSTFVYQIAILVCWIPQN
jgi:hypothetical protein